MAKHYSIHPEIVHLQNGKWVVEMVAFDNVRWDHQWTGSPGFPIEAILGVNVRRWITRPCSTKEVAEAEKAAFVGGGATSDFFEIYVEDSYPRSYPTEPLKGIPEDSLFFRDLP